MTDKKIIFLPFWVEKALVRNKLSLEACLDFNKVRQCLSLEDTASLLALQQVKAIARNESLVNRTLFNSWCASAKDSSLVELQQTISPLSCSIELIDETLKRLKEDTSGVDQYFTPEASSDKVYYRVCEINRDVAALIVYPGFLEYTAKPENLYNVVMEQLKVFYVYMKNHDVSLLPLFREYVSLLKFKTSTQ